MSFLIGFKSKFIFIHPELGSSHVTGKKMTCSSFSIFFFSVLWLYYLQVYNLRYAERDHVALDRLDIAEGYQHGIHHMH